MFTTIAAPGGRETVLFGINKRGTVVGSYTDDDAHAQRGFVYSNGAFSPVDLPFPGVYLTRPNAINKQGHIVGEYLDNGDHPENVQQHGFFKGKRVLTSIDFPGSDGGSANGINDHDHIVGFYYHNSDSGTHGFRKKGKVFTTIDVPFSGSYSTTPLGLTIMATLWGSIQAHLY
jgi:probable HAF family extracellular repeat protein